MRITVLILLFCFIGPVTAQEKTFIWADDQDYAPYIYVNAKGQAEGIFYDVMVAVFTKMNKSFEYELYPWKRAQTIVASGQADGMITIPTKERLEFLVASEPIFESIMKVHYNKKNNKSSQIAGIRSVTELKKYAVVDYIGDGWAESHLADHNVIWAPNYTSAILMVAVNRGDIFLDDPISIKFHIKKQIEVNPELTEILQLIKRGEHSIVSTPLCLLVRKDSSHVSMLKQFNTTLLELKASGEYKKIVERYVH